MKALRECHKCHQEKSLTAEFFNKDKNCPGGRRYQCRECDKFYHKNYPKSLKRLSDQKYYQNNKLELFQRHLAWRKANSELYHQRLRENHRKLKREIFNIYGGCICANCKISDIDVLTIDHIQGGGTQHRKKLSGNGLGATFYHWLKRNNYPKGYQVLCFNCNIKKFICRERL
jgi:hypothetical protein